MNIQIVNENDELIGLKPRGEVNPRTDIYRVAALWIANSRGEVLIAQRKITKDKDPGMWGPAVAGTVDEGETYEQNIYKEADEEIGLTEVDFALGPKQRVSFPRNYFCQWYTVALDRDVADFRIQETEVEQIKWMPAGALLEDVRVSPTSYIPTMPVLTQLFISKSNS